jgi:superfamily II DNA or RNA helicase
MQILPSSGDEGGHRAVLPRHVRVGDRVRARCQRWLVTDVRSFDDCSLVTLTGVGPGNLGVEERLLSPFDRLELLAVRRRLRRVSRSRWRRVCRTLLASDGSAAILRTALRARMDLLPHQLEPALAVARGMGSRMLIADDVGLGKTAQAGLVIAELRARGAASRVLVLTPAGLRQQWVEELDARFRLTPALLDVREVSRRQQALPVGVNPWSTEPIVVTSIDYVKRPEVLPAVLDCRWDVVIVDEAHGAVSGTDRHEAASALCRLAPHVLLLTATPHNGDVGAFESLCGIGAAGDTLLVFRRTRQEVGLPLERRIHQLGVRPSQAEHRMHACLARFSKAVEREHGGRDPAIGLALATLRKRALSSAFSLDQSVQRRLAHLAGGQGDTGHQLELQFNDCGGEAADDLPRWTVPEFRNTDQERRLLERLAEAAQRAAIGETKLGALSRLLRRLGEPAVVFTEYRDTLSHVRDVAVPDAVVLHGGLSRAERRTALARFDAGAVLLATDAAGEGLNLHRRCRVVINLELPWNPMRLEQRIGRVDRIGQRRRVHVFHLIARGTGEMRMLARLVSRVARARADIGVSNPLDARDVSAAPSGGVGLVCLAGEAEREKERLVAARALAVRSLGEVLEASAGGPCATRSARHRTRAWLGTRMLVLFQSTLCDSAGRIVASHVTPVLVRGASLSGQALADLDALAARATDSTLLPWREETLGVHQQFWQRRLDRELAIAQRVADTKANALQLVLFDLRAEHDRRANARRRREALERCRRQADLASRSIPLIFHPPVTVLVLLP